MNWRFNSIIVTAIFAGIFCSIPAFAGLEDILYEKGTITDSERTTIKADQEKTDAKAREKEEKLRKAIAEDAQTAKPEKKKEYPDMNSHWKGGLRFKSADGNLEFKVGGRIQHDFAHIEANNTLKGQLGDDIDTGGTEFRRMRMYMSGQLYDNVTWKNQVDFANGVVAFKDVYIGIHNLPGVGNLKVGHMKEPFGLEMTSSSNHITFMERSQTNIFDPERNTGAMFYNTGLENRMTWAAGVFLDSGDQGESFNALTGEATHFTARITALPLYKDKGKKLIHLGVSATHRQNPEDEMRLRARPEVHLTDRLINTDHFTAKSENRIKLESAAVFGPFSIQGEYDQSFVRDGLTQADDSGSRLEITPNFSGFYMYGSYFLTGESRAYKTKSGEFTQVKPKKNFGKDGIGAWEVAARYSHLDLTDSGIFGGKMDNITVGLNWYLSPNSRLMLNYVKSKVNFTNPSIAEEGNMDAVMTRFQVTF